MTGCPIDPQNRGNAVGGWNYTGPPQDRFKLGLEGIKRRLRSKWTNMVDLCDHMVGFPAATPPRLHSIDRAAHQTAPHVQIEEGNKAYKGTQWENSWSIYHDPLKQFFEKETVDYMASRGFTAENGRIIASLREGPYKGALPPHSFALHARFCANCPLKFGVFRPRLWLSLAPDTPFARHSPRPHLRRQPGADAPRLPPLRRALQPALALSIVLRTSLGGTVFALKLHLFSRISRLTAADSPCVGRARSRGRPLTASGR